MSESCAVCSFRSLNRPGFPGECFICELRLPDHRFRWKHNKLFLLLPEEYGPAFP
ncbi:fusaric acid resistance family protein, partial [Escherichia coli]